VSYLKAETFMHIDHQHSQYMTNNINVSVFK
jgi:hypothetical protein